MAKTQTVLQVFVASPGDVAEERQLLSDVVSELNKVWGSRNGVMLELVKWETDSHPGFGADAQDVINSQISDTFDVFIGIMWGRFGTPTKRAESGTEEEFLRAFRRHTDSPGSVQILFYFKDAAIAPSKIDIKQLAKVQEFKEKIQKEYGGLCHVFESADQFQTGVRMHLSQVVQEWQDKHKGQSNGPLKGTSSPEKLPATNESPLAHLMAIDLDDAANVGLIELVEAGTEAMEQVTSVVTRMAEATNSLSDRFLELTTETHDLAKRGADIRAAKTIANKAADELELFVKRLSVEIVEFEKQNSIGMDAFGKVAMMAKTDFNEPQEDIEYARSSMRRYEQAMTNSFSSLAGFRDSISKLPRMTSPFNRARKCAVAVMDDLLNQLQIAASQCQDVDAVLERLENAHPDDSQQHEKA